MYCDRKGALTRKRTENLFPETRETLFKAVKALYNSHDILKSKGARGMERQWWHDKVGYQIWPKSFQDSNGDGIGDLPGVISRLDDLKDLGVDLLWLSPVYASPLADQGYDIADYYGIDPRFGSMEDMRRLLVEAGRRDMHVLMDLVVNHCSDEHEWFQKAVADPTGPYGEFFYFRKGKNGAPPCNWRGYFGGSVWSLVPGQTDLYYLHLFHEKQPDLNWENPALRREIYKMVNWWLEQGLAGFRIDAIVNIGKPGRFRDYPADRPDGLADCQRMLEEPDAKRNLAFYLAELRDNTFRPHKAFTVGEVFNTEPDELKEFVGENGYFSSVFDFGPTCFGKSEKGWFAARKPSTTDYRDCCFASQRAAQGFGFLSNILENHDEPRGVSHYLPLGSESDPQAQKALATVSFMLPGLPFLYQGQELGMTNTPIQAITQVDDVNTHGEYEACLEAGLTADKALQVVAHYSRDNARTPMQWSAAAHAGFTAGVPWLAENPNYITVNAAAQRGVPGSVLEHYKSLISLRKNELYKETVVWGDFEPLFEQEEALAAFWRRGEKKLLVLSNLSGKAKPVALPGNSKSVLINNEGAAPALTGQALILAPWQALVLEME